MAVDGNTTTLANKRERTGWYFYDPAGRQPAKSVKNQARACGVSWANGR